MDREEESMQALEEHLQRGGFDLSSLSLSTSYHQTGRRGTVVIGLPTSHLLFIFHSFILFICYHSATTRFLHFIIGTE
ncbi:uncharacterized protein ACA1_290150 [Acanthamoeba castellanii str. Neff]|uniref:Uncharacterized protein n=1 Tax=Acanthamoeba castellanii (strain ATCC 30010 / Neff) TaxID=1257118 RepID=L8HLH4_ACACF|nr:uncharacterized protein ACA1_290150 [Acanthamoeba castellanii str. Neff]ELR25251.1 hypothetical protein ACA1_290150 [Acanthamoeba castellanii str. Neff]